MTMDKYTAKISAIEQRKRQEEGEVKEERKEAEALSPEEKEEQEDIRKFKEGVQRSVEESESKRWGPDEPPEDVPIDLAKMGAKQLEVYRKTQERLKGFSTYKVISELAGLKTDVSQLLATFAQFEKKWNEINSDEDLSPKGKAKKLREIQDSRSGTSEQLNSVMTRIRAFTEIAEAEGYRQESLSEDQFGMMSGDKSPRSDYALYSELKLGRLHNEFGSFGSTKKFDSTLNKTVTEVDYEWLSRRYTSATQRGDRASMYFVEELMANISKNESSFQSRKGTGHLRGQIQMEIETMRKSRRDESLNDTLDDLRDLERKGREMRIRSHKSPSEKVFESMKKFWI